MAVDQLETIIGRLAHDKAFRVKYCEDPDAALQAYLSPQEIKAIKSGDGHTRTGIRSGRWDEMLASLCKEVPAD
jgi:hypothetical protein